MSKLRTCPKIWGIAIFVFLSGCANDKAHENFKEILAANIGRDFDSVQPIYRNWNLEVVKLPNGNSEYRYTIQYKRGNHRPCTEIFEVDPTSQKILRADFVGSEHDCIVPL
jgi:hypothetical protein